MCVCVCVCVQWGDFLTIHACVQLLTIIIVLMSVRTTFNCSTTDKRIGLVKASSLNVQTAVYSVYITEDIQQGHE